MCEWNFASKMCNAHNKSEKTETEEWITFLNQERIRTLGEEENYKYLEILEGRYHWTNRYERKGEKNGENYWRTRKLFETNFWNWNFTKWIKISVIPFVRYSRPFLKRVREELRQMSQIQKSMPIHKALHTENDIDRFYVSRNEGGIGLNCI